jgi:hypothetical protein
MGARIRPARHVAFYVAWSNWEPPETPEILGTMSQNAKKPPLGGGHFNKQLILKVVGEVGLEPTKA